jgi:hypothetical protein
MQCMCLSAAQPDQLSARRAERLPCKVGSWHIAFHHGLHDAVVPQCAGGALILVPALPHSKPVLVWPLGTLEDLVLQYLGRGGVRPARHGIKLRIATPSMVPAGSTPLLCAGV